MDFERLLVQLDIWVYGKKQELLGRFNADDILSKKTFQAIMNDVEQHLIDEGLLIPDKYQSIGSDNADYFVQEESI